MTEAPTWPANMAARYRERGYWRGETFGDLLCTWAGRGERTAIVDGRRRLSYRELDAAADSLAAGLRGLGVDRGDRVVVQLPNVAEFFEVVFALFRLGALPVFALPAHRDTEVAYFARHSGAVAYVTTDVHEGFDHRDLAARVTREVPTLREVVVVGEAGAFTALDSLRVHPDGAPPGPAANDVAFLQLSGGSTGLPKLIPRTHDDYIYSVRASAEICGLDSSTVYLCTLPVAHNYPLSSPGVLGTLYAGGRVVLAPRPTPDVAFDLIEDHGVTITGVVPSLALVWLDAAGSTERDLSSLQVLQVGGARFDAAAAARVRPSFGATLQQVFGMAEGLVNYTRLDDPDEIVETTQGRPISPDDEIRVVDDEDRDLPVGEVGHLLTRGPYTVRGYYRADEHNAHAFTADGFYRTGDLVRTTSTGHLVVEGRAKDQINRGGEKVAAAEVEGHLLAHPGVRDAAVTSIPDPYLGERVCAYVQPATDGRPSPAELRDFVRGRGVAAYKVPDRVEVVESLPATGVGKVDKKSLRAALREQWEERCSR